MSLIHIARNNAVLGQFTEDEVRTGLTSGAYLATDLAWRTGLSQWKPLGEWPEFAEQNALPAPAGSVNPIESDYLPTPSWERRKELGSISAFCRTTKEIITSPHSTFSLMKTEGGIGTPLVYLLIPGAISGIIQSAVSAVVMISGGQTDMIPAWLKPLGVAAVAGYFLVSGIMSAALIAFIKPAIIHLFLKLYKGTNSGYETTFRATSYAAGAIGVIAIPLSTFMLVPHVGMAAIVILIPIGIYGIVLDCIAVGRAQKTDTWRVVMAMLTPGLICCCFYMVGIFVFFGIFAAAKGMHP